MLDKLKNVLHGGEPVVVLNLLAGAAAASVAAAEGVSVGDPEAQLTAAAWAVFAFVLRQFVSPAKRVKEAEEYADSLEDVILEDDLEATLALEDAASEEIFYEEVSPDPDAPVFLLPEDAEDHEDDD